MNARRKTLLCLLFAITCAAVAQDCFIPCPPGTFCPASDAPSQGIPLYEADQLDDWIFSNAGATADNFYPPSFCGTIENN